MANVFAPLTADEWKAIQERVARENDAALRRDLKAKYAVPDEFMDLAVRIWWDGKED